MSQQLSQKNRFEEVSHQFSRRRQASAPLIPPTISSQSFSKNVEYERLARTVKVDVVKSKLLERNVKFWLNIFGMVGVVLKLVGKILVVRTWGSKK